MINLPGPTGRRAELCRKNFILAITRAHRKEQAMKEYLQMRVGELSLEESVRSIEEGKRIKILTILAAVFAPISVGTSFFGMNIRELNDNGPHLWVFFTATAGICCLALSLWVFLSHFLQWRRSFSNRPAEGVSFPQRLSALWFLIRQGRMGWSIMHRHRLFLSLLTDGRITFDATYEGNDFGLRNSDPHWGVRVLLGRYRRKREESNRQEVP